MAKQIARLLKTDMSISSDLKELAKMLQAKGRGRDTILAHITPREAEILKAAGGSGATNPHTGLMEFQESFDAPETFQTQMDVTAPSAQVDVGAPAAAAGPSPQDVAYMQSQGPAQVGLNQAVEGQMAGPSAEDIAYMQSQGPAQFGLNQAVQSQTGVLPAYAAPTVDTYAAPPTAPALSSPAAAGMTQDQLKAMADYAQAEAIGKPAAAATPGAMSKLSEALGISRDTLGRLGLAGALALASRPTQRQAAAQAGAAKEELQQVAQPYQAQGQQLVGAAQRGELTPQSMQAYRALQAQLAQGVEARGGVGAQQSAAQLEAFRQQLLQNQYQYGLNVAQIGDNIAVGAIRTGLQQDQMINQATQNFYTNLAQIAAGIPMARPTP